MSKLFILKLLLVPILALSVLSIAPSVSALSDDDGDSVADVTENAAPNDGDNNYDFAQDAQQNTVASIPNPNDTAAPDSYVTLQVGETHHVDGEFPYTYSDSAWKIDEFKAVDVASLPSQPDNTVFPVGMFDIKLSCKQNEVSIRSFTSGCTQYNKVETEEGCEWVASPIPADLTLIFDRVMDTSNWTTRKYDPTTDTYIDYSPYVTIEPENTDFGYARTVIKWSIIDGQFGDSDGTVNGSISDPIGPSVPKPVVSTTPATTVASTISPKTLQHTGNNLALYSILLGILMVGSGLTLARKN